VLLTQPRLPLTWANQGCQRKVEALSWVVSKMLSNATPLPASRRMSYEELPAERVAVLGGKRYGAGSNKF
jgi:hypothetical protein